MVDVVDAMNGVIAKDSLNPYNLIGEGTEQGGAWKQGLGDTMPGPAGTDDCTRGRSVHSFHDPTANKIYFSARSTTYHVFQVTGP